MTLAPPEPKQIDEARPRRRLGETALIQLVLARLREFYREPEAIFWVYGFPTVLAVVLGWAFQNRPPAPIQVDLVEGPGSSWITAALEAHNESLEREAKAKRPRLDVPSVLVRGRPRAEAMRAAVNKAVPDGASSFPS